MMFILAGVLAAIVSWIGNRAALKYMSTKAIVLLAPFIEELAKTGAAALTGGSLVLTHGVFGLIEGVYDAWNSGLSGIKAGVVSVIGHLFYGYISFLVLLKFNVFFSAVAAGYAVHMLWNIAVMKFLVKRE